jgi:hypothetical protein
MMKLSDLIRCSSVVLLVILALSSPTYAESLAPGDVWTFSLKPYLWLPSVNGTLKYEIPPGSGAGPEVDLGSYILENLSFAGMVSGEARRGDWAVAADFIYLDVNSDNSSVKAADFAGPFGKISVAVGANINTKSRLTGEFLELIGERTLARHEGSTIDLLAGLRYLTIRASTDWQLAADAAGPGPGMSFVRAGVISERAELLDGIIGVRGRVMVGSSAWAIPYYLDAGAGSSRFTWQAFTGIEYRFSWGDVQLSYRYIYYTMGTDDMLQGVSFSGPGLGANFRF